MLDKLPMIRKIHELSESERTGPDGRVLQKIGQVITWQIEYIPGGFFRVQHVQIKYASPESEAAGENPRITLAPKPLQPIEKGLAGPGLLAYIITSKFADHLPLYRLQNIFERNGFEIARSTMSVWTGDAADLVRPLYELMKKRVLASHVIGTDDTVLPMQHPGRVKKARIWIYRGDEDHPYNVFDFTLGRGRDGPELFLGDYCGVLLADAYGGYDGICLENAASKAGCWSHGRRKFTDAQTLAPVVAACLFRELHPLAGRPASVKTGG
jgi:transposase